MDNKDSRIAASKRKKSLINKADNLCSGYVKLRDKKCRRCGQKYGLDWAHVFSREYKEIRWHEDNSLALCHETCHLWADSCKEEFRDWWRMEIGDERFDELIKLKNNPFKITIDFLSGVVEELKQRMSRVPLI